MQLIDEKEKLLKFWSVRASLLSALFGILELMSQMTDALPFMKGLVPDRTFALLSLACAVAAPILRVIKQMKLHDETDQP
jgi:hypothetical protein